LVVFYDLSYFRAAGSAIGSSLHLLANVIDGCAGLAFHGACDLIHANGKTTA